MLHRVTLSPNIPGQRDPCVVFPSVGAPARVCAQPRPQLATPSPALRPHGRSGGAALCYSAPLLVRVQGPRGRMVWPWVCRRQGCMHVGVPFFTCERGAHSLVTSEPAAGQHVCGRPPLVPIIGEVRALVLQSCGITHASACSGSVSMGRHRGVSCKSTFARLLGESSA
jgi:hypothetical protein